MRNITQYSALVLLTAGILAAPLTGARANLVQNPTFTPSGTWNYPGYLNITSVPDWTVNNSAGVSPINPAGNLDQFWDNGYVPGQGTSGYIGFMQSGGTALRQTISGLQTGDTYSLSFYATAEAYSQAQSGQLPWFRVTMNSTGGTVLDTVVSDTEIGSTAPQNNYTLAWPKYTGSFVATQGTEVLTFLDSTSGGYQNAILIAAPDLVDTAAVPEPASIALFGLGVTALGTMRRRRQVRAA